MKVSIALYGALRDANPSGKVELDVPDQCNISDLRELFKEHLHAHAPAVSSTLVARSAFASSEEILHDERAVPAHGELAILPPVSGG